MWWGKAEKVFLGATWGGPGEAQTTAEKLELSGDESQGPWGLRDMPWRLEKLGSPGGAGAEEGLDLGRWVWLELMFSPG